MDAADASRIERLDEGLVPSLRDPAGLSLDPAASQGVQYIQTHISHLFLTRDRVYKLRKAVELPFLTFATREARNADCLREVALNRRLAPDVYLGVAAAIRSADGGWQLGPPGESLCDEAGAASRGPESAAEHCVVMRRLPDGRDALSMLEDGKLRADHIDGLADRLVDFHRGTHLGAPAPWLRDEWLERIRAPIDASFELAREAGKDVLDRAQLDEFATLMETWFEEHRDWLLARREQGRAVDGHGDLHLDHVWYPEDDEAPVAIDCIEFDAGLRQIDVAAELAFFVMDAAYRGRDDLAERLLARYAAVSDDYDLYHVVDYHVLHRSLVRASVAAVACNETEVTPAQRDAAAKSARRHVELMKRLLQRRPAPAVIVTTGLPGTGKSTVANEAAVAIGGVPIVADRVRKHLAGLAATERGDGAPDEGLYSADVTAAVYRGLLERAVPVLESGRAVVLDATHSTRWQREAALAFAREGSWPAILIDVRCPEPITRQRIRARLEESNRVSDADEAIYEHKRAAYESPDEWPHESRIEIDTHDEKWRDRLRAELLRRLP